MSKLEIAARQVVANGVQGTYAKYYSVPPADFEALREALAEQALQKLSDFHQIMEQEPMYISESCAERGCACHYSVEVDGEPVTVYATPVRTKDMTDEEISKLRHKIDWTAEWSYVNFARAVIQADREKNK